MMYVQLLHCGGSCTSGGRYNSIGRPNGVEAFRVIQCSIVCALFFAVRRSGSVLVGLNLCSSGIAQGWLTYRAFLHVVIR